VEHFPNSRQLRVVAAGGVEFLETANPGISTDEWNANLNLLAAAPDLLAACKDAVRLMDTMANTQAARILDAAIAKAEGR
jgi:hypothetical protein